VLENFTDKENIAKVPPPNSANCATPSRVLIWAECIPWQEPIARSQ
jgi:hypothetical protein